MTEMTVANEPANKVYGGMLVGSALLSVLGALHHPRVEVHEIGAVVRSLAGQATLIEGVHGALLAIFFVQYAGFYGFARRLGLGRPLIAGGWILLSLGTFAMASAAAINGFALPRFAADYAGLAPQDARAVVAVLKFSWALNQAWAQIGAIAWGGAILLWSIALVRMAGLARWLGFAGLGIALVLVGGLLGGLFSLDVAGFVLVTSLLAAWAIGAGLLLIAERVRS
ncbi:MAG: hypothetical protein JWP15_2048 [Alphaproteobacteria bacterium]|nr:hypothetical protein [Alphaproteobacteria bacterium]